MIPLSSRKRGFLFPVFAGMTALAGCGPKAADENTYIACQPAGASAFTRDCTVERSDDPEGAALTLRHADGRFRRLLITRDGQGVIAADGAERAAVRMAGNTEIEVMVGGDRYRLPARPKKATGGTP